MSKYKGLFTFDSDSHKYVSIENADEIISCINFQPEPKEAWAIGEFGELYEVSGLPLNRIEKLKEIGNYFETEDEAEKAVERLKVLKRLKDNNLRFRRGRMTFVNTDDVFTTMDVGVKVDTYVDVEADLDLLFGGEE